MAKKYKREELLPGYKPPEDNTQSKVPPVPTSEKASQGVRFNNDGSVDVQIKGSNPARLQKDEYGAFRGEGGRVSPQVEKLRQLEENQRLKQTISDQLKRGATISQITKDLLMQEQQKQGPQMAQDETLQPGQSSTTPPLSTTNKPKASPLNPFSEKPFAGISEAVSSISKGELPESSVPAQQALAEVWDFVYSLTTEGKGMEQRDAEKLITKIDGEIDTDISLVRQGLKDPSQVKRNLALYQSAISDLDNSIKGANRINVRFFRNQGKDVRTMVLLYQDNLKDYEDELNNAILENRMAQAQASFGQ